ncbi:MAG: rane fusion protein heavy metal efflux system [Acidobacteriota bacterium]|nr:rane fusion protein heavy metal efflux system [Acidobacteriota bacterium]
MISDLSRRWTLWGTFALATLATLALPLISCGRQPTAAAKDEKAAAEPAASTTAAERPKELTLDPAQRQKVRLERVGLSSFRPAIETTGTVAFDQNRATQVLAPISGPVARLEVQVGAQVSRGQTLATVASPDFATDVSALRKAEATAKNARRVASLDQELFKNGGIARRDVEQAETEAVAAEADRDAALEQLRALGVEKSTLNDIMANRPVAGGGGAIRAPLAGTVVERLITPGQLLQAGTTPCFTVADLRTVWVKGNIFESDLPLVAPGDQAEIRAGAGGTPVTGRVDYISAIVDPATRAIPVRIVAPNPGGVFKRDLYVRVTLRSNREATGLLVPDAAVLRDDENLPFVFVANASGAFARRRVEIGARVGDRQQITSGLNAGETIVADGGLFLQFAENQ